MFEETVTSLAGMQVLKGRDRCVFYHPGWPDPPLDLQIINHMLAHMRILCLFNQFTESLFGHAHSFEVHRGNSTE